MPLDSPTASGLASAAPSPSASASAAPLTTAPTELVHRPEPGLARGVWEGPPWMFVVGPALILLIAAVYAALRIGLVRKLRRKRATR